MYSVANSVNKMYRGTRKVFEAFEDKRLDELDYLCFTANTARSTIKFTNYGGSPAPIIYVSTDNKETWTQWNYEAITLANVGDKVYMYGENPNGICTESKIRSFAMTGSIAASGDITTLLTREGTKDLSGKPYCFYRLFMNCNSLTTPPSLPATILSHSCYVEMFQYCSNLTSSPVLPAQTLTHDCYKAMFDRCTSLTEANSIYAITMDTNSCESMFNECSSLVNPPLMMATTVRSQSCFAMFQKCTSLKTGPQLPATTLASYCYWRMFKGCTSLEVSPVLPATTLVTGCYEDMFHTCSKLKDITCLATNISAVNCTSGWVTNVGSGGTFKKAPSMSSWGRDSNGIPTSWTVQDYSE